MIVFKLNSSDLPSVIKNTKTADRVHVWSGRSDLLGNPPGPGFGRSLAVGGASANSNSSSPSEQHLRREKQALPAGRPQQSMAMISLPMVVWRSQDMLDLAGLTTPRTDQMFGPMPILQSTPCPGNPLTRVCSTQNWLSIVVLDLFY
jgi:hypothetical protein